MATQEHLSEISRGTLELFIDRTEKLYKYMSEDNHLGGLVGVYSKIGEDDWKRYPELDGFVTTFRWFIQSERKDEFDISLFPLTLNGLVKRPKLLDMIGVSDNWRGTVKEAWESGKNFLELELADIGEPITRLKIIEVFIYGDIIHATQRATFRKWQGNPDLFGKVSLHLTSSLAFLFFEFILPVARACKQELDR